MIAPTVPSGASRSGLARSRWWCLGVSLAVGFGGCSFERAVAVGPDPGVVQDQGVVSNVGPPALMGLSSGPALGFVVAISVARSGSRDATYACLGSAVTSSAVVTAAHCLDGVSAVWVEASNGALVRASSWRLASGAGADGARRDAAVLFVSDALPATVAVDGTGRWPDRGTAVSVLDIPGGANRPLIVNQVPARVVSSDRCVFRMSIHCVLPDSASEVGTSSRMCPGESGGPILVVGTEAQAPVLVGVATGGDGCSSAADSSPTRSAQAAGFRASVVLVSDELNFLSAGANGAK